MSLNFLGLPIINFEEIKFLGGSENDQIVINCMNAWSFYCFYHNPLYKKAVQNSYNLADGMSIIYGNRFLKAGSLKRFTGYDVLMHLLNHNEQYDINKVMFIGSSEKVQKKIDDRLKKKYPMLESSLMMLPFKESFQESETALLKKEIEKFKPDIFFVGLSAPKQEIFTYQHLKNIKEVKLICNIGAAFNFFAGSEPRAPQWVQKIGFEGFYRTIFNPIKHLRKDVRSYPYLIKELIKYKLK